uniref:Acyl carrier protein n=1 Tax=Parastrongyloides trichosuri TaxID=131310 RepID=A0A0N4Z5S1_PARTI
MFGRILSRTLTTAYRGISLSSGQSTFFKAAIVSTNILPISNLHTTNTRHSAKVSLTKAQVEGRIKLVLGCFDKVKKTDFSMDDDLFKDLGLDSLDHVELICTIEEEFGFEIPDGIADQFKTPKDIFQFICDKEDVFE